MKIIDLDDYRKVWSTGAAACAACGHEWQAVYPVGAEDVGLECPACGSGHGSVLTITQMAKGMWEAYAIRLGGKNYKGEPLKSWDNLDEDFQYCWIGVSEVISERTFKLEADNERLRKALQLIAAPSKVIVKGEEAVVALQLLLSSHRRTALKALGEGE